MATPTPSSNTPQKHLMAHSSPAPRSVPPMAFDSPAVLNMLNDGAIGMGISMSGMGLSQLGLSQLGRADEDERRRRLENIVHMLKGQPGRVSEEGIIALCKKEGIDFERAVEGDGTTVLTLVIGNEAMCDITIAKGDVTSVKLELASDDDSMFRDSGSRILFKSLTPAHPGANKINLMLDQFAMNLDKLLRMDKLSAENGGVPCFKAIFAMHKSLKRLFEHEKKMALALIDADAPDAVYKAEREVLCKKSGRPRLNAGTHLGLSLEYWMDRRHLMCKPPKPATTTASSSSSSPPNDEDYPEDALPTTHKIYSLSIECESSPSSMYTPIRIPPSWISDSIYAEKPPTDGPDAVINNILENTPPAIDWLDPKPTYLDPAGAAGDHSALNIENASGRLPNIRFVARFHPPIVLPWTVYANIMNSVGLEAPQEFPSTSFVGLAVRPDLPDPGSTAMSGGHTIEVKHSRTVLAVDRDGNETTKRHASTFYVPRLEFSLKLESLPFQHPRQLVELLPTLRQYAFTTSLIQESFVPKTNNTTSTNVPAPPPPNASNGDDSAEPPLQLDISLYYAQPAPRLTLHMPHPSSPPSIPPFPTSTSTSSAPPPSSSPSSTLPTDPADLLAYLLSSTSTEPTSQDADQTTNSNVQRKEPTALKKPIKVVVDIASNAEVFVQEQTVFPDDEGDEDPSSDPASDPAGENTVAATSGGDNSGGGEEMEIDKKEEGEEEENEKKGESKNGSKESKSKKSKKRPADRIAHALDVCGDLDVWGEWIARECSSSS